MRKIRQTKLIVIITLTIAICGMTLGFAAFSNILTISSSATVKPDESGFQLKMFGFTGENFADVYNFDKYTSENSANIILVENQEYVLYDGIATIDSDSLSLNLGNVKIKNPDEGVFAFVKIVNKGNFDAYFDSSQFADLKINGECVADDGTSEVLVSEVCPYIIRGAIIYTEESFEKEGEYNAEVINYDEYDSFLEQDCFYRVTNYGDDMVCKLAKGEQVMLVVVVGYNKVTNGASEDITPRADGPFSVSFSDLKLEFITTPPIEIEERDD